MHVCMFSALSQTNMCLYLCMQSSMYVHTYVHKYFWDNLVLLNIHVNTPDPNYETLII